MSYRAQVQADSDAEPGPHPEHLFLSHKVSRGQFTGFRLDSSYISLNIRRQNYTIHSTSGLHTFHITKYRFSQEKLYKQCEISMKHCSRRIAEARWPILHNFKNKHDIILLYLKNKN
jgi:hypothetical protein